MVMPQCRLQTLKMGGRGRFASLWEDLELESKVALLEALPSLQTFCGMSRESFIRDWKVSNTSGAELFD